MILNACNPKSEEKAKDPNGPKIQDLAPGEKSKDTAADSNPGSEKPAPDTKDPEVRDDTKRWIGMNDISVLFPLNDTKNLIAPLFNGDKGQLLPFDVFAQVPASQIESASDRYTRVRLMSIRFDPCFPKLLPDTKDCSAVIRMVWQSLLPKELNGNAADLASESEDISFHSFYTLTQEEWKAVAKDLSDLRAASGFAGKRDPLTVNPALKKEGLTGPQPQCPRHQKDPQFLHG